MTDIPGGGTDADRPDEGLFAVSDPGSMERLEVILDDENLAKPKPPEGWPGKERG